MIITTTEIAEKRKIFFSFIFGSSEGYVCIARRKVGTTEFEEEFFRWPAESNKLSDYIHNSATHYDVWYCPQLLNRRARRKTNVKICPTVWADMDECDPNKSLLQATVTIESSPGRYQSLWKFDPPLDPAMAEDISKRIAYYHAPDGADKSGWDLTQLLRVPFTHNFKYGTVGTAPTVNVLKVRSDATYAVEDFDVYPIAEKHDADNKVPFPNELPGENGMEILMRYRSVLHPMVFVIYHNPPEGDWSKSLWALETLCFESNLSREEVFLVARDSAVNKYERDGRSDAMLWRDVCRAWSATQESVELVTGVSPMDVGQALLTPDERELVLNDKTIVEEYGEWARTLGDASPQYHQAGIFVVLSSILASSVRLPTSFGTIKPNLWFLIMADTTLTRKTTSMDVAMELLSDIDDDAILATDGSIEGLFTGLSTRPGRASIFLRDEFTGLLEAMTKKDYMAGMGEALTKLYDGKYQKRILKRETIEVKDPVVIVFGGGIKNRLYELLTYEHISSGFLPRFCFITAEADVTKLRPVGPPTVQSTSKRNEILATLKGLYDRYNKVQIINAGGNQIVSKQMFEATLTEDAWARYNIMETQMLSNAMGSSSRDILTPMYDRLSKSGLKAAVLIAASRNKEKVVVEEIDILHAFFYVEQWRQYANEIVANVGKSTFERTIDGLVRAVEREPGIYRGTLMRIFKLSARQMDEYLTTCDQRGLISRVRAGKTEQLYPANNGQVPSKKTITIKEQV